MPTGNTKKENNTRMYKREDGKRSNHRVIGVREKRTTNEIAV